MRHKLPALFVCALLAQTAAAADTDPCTRFAWDVSHELSVMKQTPRVITAADKPGKNVPQLQLDTLYEIKLATQSGVTFVMPPGKPTLPDGAHAGLATFHTGKAGRYRVSITSGHWIDVVQGRQLVRSRDFQGARGCERPRKIVEYDLPADRELTLQLSGSPDAAVVLSVTPVTGSPAS